MNRIDFMQRLELLLLDIPKAERQEAIQYYEDYLDDAGVENEQEVLEALGTPEELAASIREGLKEDTGGNGEFSENGYHSRNQKNENEIAHRRNPDDFRQQHSSAEDFNRRYRKEKKKGMSPGMLALVIILGILALPVGLPVALAIGIVVLVLAIVAVILVAVFLFVGVICVIAGIISIWKAVVELFLFPAGAVLSIGISLVVIGVGILLCIAIGMPLLKLLTRAFRKTVDTCSGRLHKKGGDNV
ncbi:MAG: hypothetical protein IJ390_11345 [Lachnospiraceae bacterium]|nr:hypothetical protein [Lachnospiraceae bacterium]